MWYEHLLSMPKISFGHILVLLVTWPYHRTFNYFTLDPATRLAQDLERHASECARHAGELASAINHWCIGKDQEYDFVMTASTLAAIADISVFSWTDIGNTYWLATAFFYFSLSLSLWAVILSAQQKSVTRTLITHQHINGADQDDAAQLLLKVRVILRCPENGPRVGKGRTFAELNMLYVWQCPLMMMSYGWATLLLGLTLHVCSPLISDIGPHKRKVAIFYLVTGGWIFINFIWASAWSFWLPKMSEDVERATFRRSSMDWSMPSTRSGTLWLPDSRAGPESKEKLQLMTSKTL